MIHYIQRHITLIAVAVLCTGAGAAASAIANATAASTSPPARMAHHGMGHHGLSLRALVHRTVAGNLVVATRRGFVHVTVARGLVRSVGAHSITLTEGTPRASYRTVTLKLPAKVRVRDNRRRASLGQVSAGQRAIVVIAPRRALVAAHTPKRA
jgi:hypothetical protein